MEILDKPDIELSVYALGPSGLVILYDDTIPAGGLLHYMLPDSSLSPERAINQPNLFADTGIQPLVESFIQRFGSKKENIKVFLAGGSNAQTENDSLKIGEKNIEQASIGACVFGHEEKVFRNSYASHSSAVDSRR